MGHHSAMKWTLLAAFILGCSPAVAVPPAATTAPNTTAAPVPFDPKLIEVTFVAAVLGDDRRPERIANDVAFALPSAWAKATGGRSKVVNNTSATMSPTGVLIIVDSSMNPRQLAYAASGPRRVIVMHQIPDANLDTLAVYTRIVIHELGHVLGCCHGAGSDGTHVSPCATEPKDVAIMCDGVEAGFVEGAQTFNDYELAQMGL